MRAALRILVVEDEMTIAMMLEDMLAELGHEVVALATRLPQAETLAGRCDVDLAILDVKLSGQPSFPAAELLRERAIPMMFATGYGRNGLTSGFADAIVLEKPYRVPDLQRAIAAALNVARD